MQEDRDSSTLTQFIGPHSGFQSPTPYLDPSSASPVPKEDLYTSGFHASYEEVIANTVKKIERQVPQDSVFNSPGKPAPKDARHSSPRAPPLTSPESLNVRNSVYRALDQNGILTQLQQRLQAKYEERTNRLIQRAEERDQELQRTLKQLDLSNEARSQTLRELEETKRASVAENSRLREELARSLHETQQKAEQDVLRVQQEMTNRLKQERMEILDKAAEDQQALQDHT